MYPQMEFCILSSAFSPYLQVRHAHTYIQTYICMQIAEGRHSMEHRGKKIHEKELAFLLEQHKYNLETLYSDNLLQTSKTTYGGSMKVQIKDHFLTWLKCDYTSKRL